MKLKMIGVIFVICMSLGGVGALFFAPLFIPLSGEKKEYVITITNSMPQEKVVKTLQEKGLIHSQIPFELYLKIMYGSGHFKEGEYRIFSPISAVSVAKLFFQGPKIQERTIKIIEGWNRKDIAKYLEKEGVGRADDFLELTHTVEPFADIALLSKKPINVDMEGYLFPDTYRIFSDAKPQDIVRKLIANLESKITAEMLSEIRSHGQTVHEALTLASIVEREVQTDTDRALVADLLYRRIKLGMPLQVDSTISFITGKQNDRSSLTDLQIDSPYNTYKYKGLPPGPIANPGLSSIRAVVYPKANEYLFFLTTPEGEVKYARTYAEHLENKRKYLK